MEIKHRQPARTLKELYNNLNPLEFLTEENRHFYVKVYDDVIDDIRYDLEINDAPSHTVYITGQTGSGKTTALNFLPDKVLLDKYIFLKFYSHDLLDLNDISVIDILLMLAYELIKEDKVLEDEYRRQLERIRDKHKGRLEEELIDEQGHSGETGAAVKGGLGSAIGKFFSLFNIGLDFYANFRVDKEYRKVTRMAFQFDKYELLEITNNIIKRYISRKKKARELLIIFNELDHIKEWEIIQNLFLGPDLEIIERLECKKVLSLPLILKLKDFRQNIYFMGMKMAHNPKYEGTEREDTDEVINEHKKDLREILYKRIDDNTDLVSAEAVEFAIIQSGGIIRQFVSILRAAILKAGRNSVRLELKNVQEGAEHVRTRMRDSLITNEKIRLLEKIRTQHNFIAENDVLLTHMLMTNQIVLYENGDPWCDVNPLIEKTVAAYAAKLKHE